MACKGSLSCLTPPDQADLCSRGAERNWLLSRRGQESSSSSTASKCCFPRRQGGTLPSKTELRFVLQPGRSSSAGCQSDLTLHILSAPSYLSKDPAAPAPRAAPELPRGAELMQLHSLCAGLCHSRCSQKSKIPQVLQGQPHRKPSADGAGSKLPAFPADFTQRCPCNNHLSISKCFSIRIHHPDRAQEARMGKPAFTCPTPALLAPLTHSTLKTNPGVSART